jgi:hypothetical protein
MEGLFGIIAIVIYFLILSWWREKQRIARRDYYRKYLKTDAWKKKRYVVLKRDNWVCQRCGAKAEQVHHKKYARNIGTEPIKWLESICKDCHHKIHSKSTKSYFKPSKKTISVKRNKPKDFDIADNYITAIESKYPENSLQTNWSWSVKMNLCPISNLNEPLIDYYKNIKEGKIFCEDKNKGIHPKGLDTYHKKWKVIEHSLSDEKDKLWVIIENFDLSIQYLLIEITFFKELKIRIYKNSWIIESKSNVFLHNRFSRTFVTLDGAKKMLFEKQGKEWVGGEVIDDWMGYRS